MKKITILASAATLATVSVSASAWWGAPYGPYGANEVQQTAMLEQQAEVLEKMMAAQRRMAEQMAAHRAELAKGLPTGDAYSAYRDLPGNIVPWYEPQIPEPPAVPAFPDWGHAPDFPGPDFPALWDMPDLSQMPNFPGMPAMPPLGSAPEPSSMPGFGQMPAYPSMPEMPEPYALDIPQPPVPPFMQDRYAELEAYRARVIAESKARRDQVMKRIGDRRKEIEANRLARPYPYSRRPVRPYAEMAQAPAPRSAAPETKTGAAEASSPQPRAATAASPAGQATPTTSTESAPALEEAPASSAEQAAANTPEDAAQSASEPAPEPTPEAAGRPEPETAAAKASEPGVETPNE